MDGRVHWCNRHPEYFGEYDLKAQNHGVFAMETAGGDGRREGRGRTAAGGDGDAMETAGDAMKEGLYQISLASSIKLDHHMVK